MATTTLRPTLKHVAAETGLAVTTVSRALNDAPDINDETKKRVRAAALRIGYRPNRAGVRLRTGRSNVFSFLMSPERDLTGHTARLVHAFASRLRGTGYHLIVTPVFDDEDPLEQLDYLRSTGSADVVILNKIQPLDARIEYLKANGMPFVTHGRTARPRDHAWYDFDNTTFASLAVDALVQAGSKRILVVAPPMEQAYAQNIMEGALRAGLQEGIELGALETATADDSSLELERAITTEWRRKQFDAVLCSSVASAVAAVAAMENEGLTIGVDMNVAAKEPFPFLRRFRKPIITVSENADGAGSFLAEAALSLMSRPEAPPLQFLEVPEGVSEA